MKCVFLLLIVLISACIEQVTPPEQKICFENDKCVEVEIAKTSKERTRGLMFRDNLPEGKGMLFVFSSEGYKSIWMKNVRFPIDVIWIGKDDKIVHIESAVPPCKTEKCPTYPPSEKAFYILEVNANYTLENNIEVGMNMLGLPAVLAD